MPSVLLWEGELLGSLEASEGPESGRQGSPSRCPSGAVLCLFIFKHGRLQAAPCMDFAVANFHSPDKHLSLLLGFGFMRLPGTEHLQTPSDFTISSYFQGPRNKGLCVWVIK